MFKFKKTIIATLLAGASLGVLAGESVNLPTPTVPDINTVSKTTAPGTQGTTTATWDEIIEAPPQSKMSFRTKEQAEQALTAAYSAGALNSLPPIAGDDGSILYAYGGSWPTVVCSPLHVCVVALGKGDKPAQVVLGEQGMWSLTQAMSGDTPILALSPRFKGLHTNLMITATSAKGEGRIYYINLVSEGNKYVPRVGFYYPDEIAGSWKVERTEAGRQATAKTGDTVKTEHQTVAALPTLDISKMNFNWKISCDKSHSGGFFSSFNADCSSIKPSRVFDDGTHTYIAMPETVTKGDGLPTIMASNALGKPAIVNYRFKDGYYVIDGVPHRMNLIAGSGDGSEQHIVVIDKGE